jgi:hypothetical protein
MPPLVSVILPSTFARAGFLALARESVLLQDYPQALIEVLVEVTDGRTSASTVRNRLVAKSKGEIILLFDDDDFSFPGRVSSQVECLEKDTDKLVCGTSCCYTYDLLRGYGVVSKASIVKCCSVAFRREAWDEFKLDERTPIRPDTGTPSCGTCRFLAHFRGRIADTRSLRTVVFMRHCNNVSGVRFPIFGEAMATATSEVPKLVGDDRLDRYRAVAEALKMNMNIQPAMAGSVP